MTARNKLKAAVATGLSTALSLAGLMSAAPPAAAYAGQCGGSAADYTEAPGAGGSVAFVLAQLAQTGTKVKSVQFMPGSGDVKALTVVPADPTASASGGGWYYEEPNGPNPAKTGVANFTTTVTTADGSKYVSNFSVTDPVCNPGNRAKPSNVFQIKGDVTLSFTPAGGSATSIPGAAYSADR